MQKLETELKTLIIEALNLEDMSIDDIESEEALFGEGLGLDSIDALELGLAIKKQYNVVIDADNTETRQHFSSVSNLAKYIDSNR